MLQVGGIPGRGGRAAGIRSVALCHPGRQAAPQPRSVLASLLPDRPLPNADRQTDDAPHLHCTSTESRGSHHTVPCTHGLGAKPRGRSYVSLNKWHSAAACVAHSCSSTTIAQAGPQHSKNSTSTAQVDCGPVSVERYTHTRLGMVRYGKGTCSLWRSSGWETRQDCQTLERCSPCPCRALQCNAVREGERELGTWDSLVRRGSPDFGQSV